MQNKNDSLEKTREIPNVSEQNEGVHKDQSSMFDTADVAFSESMVVEKNEVCIDSSENAAGEIKDGGDTAVFSFPKDKKENIDAKDLEGTAKDYYNATHSSSIEDKVNELCKLADENFGDENVTDAAEVFADVPSKEALKKDKKKKKNRKRGYISNDDMELLMGKTPDGADLSEVLDNSQSAKSNLSEVTENEDGSKEYINPLGTVDENEDEKLIKVLGGKGKNFKTFKEVFDDEEVEGEYTDREQEGEILHKLRNKAMLSSLSVIVTVILTGICAYFEFAVGTKLPHPEFFETGKYGVTFAMSMLQLLFVGVLFNIDGMKRALKGLRFSKSSTEGYAAVGVMVVTLHAVLSCIMAGDKTGLLSFCSAGLLILTMLSINSFIKAYTTLNSFCIAASKLPKFSSSNLPTSSLEANKFEKYLDADTTLFTVEKNDFVKGFFKKQIVPPKASRNTVKIAIASVAVSLVVGVIVGVFKGAYTGVCVFTAMSLVSLPANALLSTALPFFLACGRAKKTQTAFIGEAACDAYENTGVVSFDDTEVFSPRSVKVSSIRTYGDNRIDRVILYMAKIFDKVGGPLSFVFANSIQNDEEFACDAKIVEHFSNGMSTRIDEKEVLIGTGDFLRLYDIEVPFDNIDESFTQALGSIMYMSVDGDLAAKFYIKYTMNRGFEAMLHAFYDAGICVGIKSCDPCITDELVTGNLRGSNYPVAVIKNVARKNSDFVNDETEGAVLSLSSVHNFLLGFIRLDNLRNVYRSNTYISLASVIIALAVGTFISVTGMTSASLSFVLIFQLLWCIPTLLFSLFSK